MKKITSIENVFDKDKLQMLRNKKGLTLHELASNAQVSYDSLINWLYEGRETEDIFVAHRLAVALDCFIDDFVADGVHIP